MNYLHAKDYQFPAKNQTAKNRRPFYLAAFALILYLWGSSFFATILAAIVYPVERLSGQITESFSDSLKSRQYLLATNKQLAVDQARVKVLEQELTALQTENTHLRFLAGSNLITSTRLYAKVLVKPIHLPYDEVIVDVGQESAPALQAGQLVFAADQVILGQVAAVDKKFSRIKLYSEGGVSLPVAVGDESYPTVASGLGGGNFSLSLPRGLAVKVGDPIRTTIVGNYLLGYVAQISKTTSDPFQEIQFRSPYNIFSLQEVFIECHE